MHGLYITNYMMDTDRSTVVKGSFWPPPAIRIHVPPVARSIRTIHASLKLPPQQVPRLDRVVDLTIPSHLPRG